MIAIIDYGMGNLRSVQKAFEKIGGGAIVTSDPHAIAAAEKVVLPGVGAFGDAMHELEVRDLIAPTKDAIRAGKPFLGICLGMQLLFDVGYEEGEFRGLGVLPGEVVRFPNREGYKVPHMGWNQLVIKKPAPIFDGVPNGAHVYFVHSYHVVPADAEVVAAEANYPDPFTAVVWKDNVFAAQFHPEKSQTDGLQMLANFAKLSVAV